MTDPKLTRSFDWRTTDQDEIELRQQRAREEQLRVRNVEPAHRIFSQFEVNSRSGMTYNVELRSLAGRAFSCTCTDFRVNGLGTCKHVEAVLLHLEARFPKEFDSAAQAGSNRIDVIWEETSGTLCLENQAGKKLPALSEYFTGDGLLRVEYEPEEVLAKLQLLELSELRISQEVRFWIEQK